MSSVYTPDAAVDAALDRELRDLLCACFTKPQDVVFRERRFFREPPQHRWLVRDGRGALVAHAAVHDKTASSAGATYRLGGVAEVCVHPEHRGHGLARGLLAEIHAWLAARQVPFAVLFGNPKVYTSSGYVVVGNLRVRSPETGAWESAQGAMVHMLGIHEWPAGPVDLVGPRF